MSKLRITMATLAALADGDMGNALVAATPGGIEAQEAQGQRDFVASETLPIKCGWTCNRGQLESMGIRFGDPVDDLFVEVQLPNGWKKVPTDHSMWSELHDERGRKRAGIFYKAAFYDRDAFIDLCRRFFHLVEPVCGFPTLYEGDNRHKSEWRSVVRDYTGIVWQSAEMLGPEPPYKPRPVWLAWKERKTELEEESRAWLDRINPDWENPLAYWNEE